MNKSEYEEKYGVEPECDECGYWNPCLSRCGLISEGIDCEDMDCFEHNER